MSAALALYRSVWSVGLALRVPQLVLRGRPEELRERLGECPRGGEPPPLWIHAASLGETTAATALVRALRTRSPGRIAMSAMTRSGKKRAEDACPEIGPVHPPLDHPAPVGRFLDRLRPSGLVVLETELWPTLVRELHRRGTPWAIASGRLSARTVRRVRWAGGVFAEILSSVSAVGARTETDAERFRRLGAPAAVVRVTGDLKEDRAVPPREAPPAGTKRWIAACTRPGEEDDVLEVVRRLSSTLPRGEVTIAPRHPERFGEVARLVERSGFPARTWAQREAAPGDGWSVLLVDEMGVLDEAYRRATCAFVGGSLRPFGGHSPLEAAAAGRAVLLGPHTESCRDAASMLEGAGAVLRVASVDELAKGVERLLTDEREAERRGRSAHEALVERSGAGERTVELLRERGVVP